MTITNSELVSAHNFERFLPCCFSCSLAWPMLGSGLWWSSRGRRTSSWGGVQEKGAHTFRTAVHRRCPLEGSYFQFLIHVLFFLFTNDPSGLPPPRSVWQQLEGTERDFPPHTHFFHPVMGANFVLWTQNTDTVLRTSEVLYLYFSPNPNPMELNVQV